MNKHVHVLLFVCLLFSCWCLPITAGAGEVLLLGKGDASIRGLLPDAWQQLSPAESQRYLRQKDNRLVKAGKLLAAFRRRSGSGSNAAPVLFVFHAAADKRITPEQREKMYAWFEKNRDVASQLAPAEVRSLSLENIEYLQNRDTIIFETAVTVGGHQLHGVSGIIFLARGYLDIIGYETDGVNRYRDEFYSFIRTLFIPKQFKYHSTMLDPADVEAWVIGHWQQIAGASLFLVVYGLVFLWKGKKRLPVSN